ncbi:MAG TPA: AsmA-like C-terminal region-containing protein [Candidatus Angelobacter sp.]|nr:AsmA-like C-terminal region-containing protein [Candidatus Angelobacter sp.]
MTSTRKKIIVVVLVVLALCIFLPPNINGTRFSSRLASTLSAALGRDVKIGSVKYRLFPRPGFDLYDFKVMDDPAFSAEPLLFCGKVTADLRLTSLWQGRLEIANLKLTDDVAPPSLNLVYEGDHWNMEPLLLRVEQVPTAPTAKRSAEQRSRFPYIQASGGRINLKLGPEKKPYTLTNTDFAFWLAAEDTWHIRLEAHPVRTDMNLNDTGTVRVEGDVKRATNLRDMPVKLQVSWEKSQLGQFSRLVLGQDKGWRGELNANAEIAGPLADLRITATADVDSFRRFDINRNAMPRVRTRCLGDYTKGILGLKCDTPFGTGGLLVTAHFSPSARNYDLSLVANRVPLSLLATLARQARRSLPDDFTATGDLNAAFGFHSHAGVHDFHGTGMSTPFLLQSAAGDKPFAVSAVRFHIGAGDTPSVLVVKKKRSSAPAQPTPAVAPSAAYDSGSFTVDAFSVQMGPSTTLEVQGSLDSNGYFVSAKGMVPMERLLAFGRATGFHSQIANTTASALVDLNVSGPWANFTAPKLRGTAHLQNLAAWIPGLKDRLVMQEADAQITDTALVLSKINGQFEHSPIAFTGLISSLLSCTGSAPCPLQFDLHLDSLALPDVAKLMGFTDKGWNLPFFSGSDNKLPEFRAVGSVSVGELNIADIPLEKFAAHVEVGDHALTINRVAARIGGGTTQGEWKVDWSGSQPRYTGSGSMESVTLERVSPQNTVAGHIAQWIGGRAQVSYATHFEGDTPQEMSASTGGRVEFQVSNGTSKMLALDAGRPLRFNGAQGALEIDRQVIKVLPSKFKAENRIYLMSGTISLANKQAKLKVSTSGNQWEITGALERPEITPQPLTAQAAPAHSK